MLEVNDNQIRKALVSMSVERTLLEMGEPVLNAVESRLFRKYNCYIPDCYEHPEYLKEVLQGLYGDSHLAIIKSIKEKLNEFTYKKSITEFIKVIEC